MIDALPHRLRDSRPAVIAHVAGYLCAADVAQALSVDRKAVHRLASRHRWRKVRRKGYREVYYNADDVFNTPVKGA